MIQIQRILFPTDFSPSAERAFSLALLLAREFGAELHMFHAIVLHESDPYDPAHHFPEPEEIRRRLEKLGDSAMAELVDASDDSGVEIHRVQRRGIEAASAILEYADQSDVDLIVMGTHGRRGLTHFFLGSVAERVVRHAECPVLTVRDVDQPSPVTSIDKILVPVDLSDDSQVGLRAAYELAERHNAQLQVFHVVEEVSYPSYYGLGPAFTEELLTTARAALDKLVLDALRPATNVQRDIVLGQRAASEIIRFADAQEADLIVMTTHDNGGLEHLFLGRTAERTVQLSTVPVLTLRSLAKGSTDDDSAG